MEKNTVDPRGYIKVWRKIWDNPVSSRAKYLSVFLFILSHANWKKKKTIIDNKTITIRRGQWLGSIFKIAEFFEDISYATAHYIVNWLKVDNIVDNKPTNKYTLFTVKNYDDYQPLDTRVDTKVITKLEQIDTTNKDNKDKKDKKNNLKITKREFGNKDINKLLDTLQEKLGLPKLDESEKTNRHYAHLTLKKFDGLDNCLRLVGVAAADKWYKNNITSAKDLYYKGIKLIARKRGGGFIDARKHMDSKN